jgi:excisionase family DNA binding protein
MTGQTNQIERSATKEDVRDFYRLKSVRTIELWMRAGLIPYTKIGKLVRFDLEEVKAAMKERCGHNRVSKTSPLAHLR